MTSNRANPEKRKQTANIIVKGIVTRQNDKFGTLYAIVGDDGVEYSTFTTNPIKYCQIGDRISFSYSSRGDYMNADPKTIKLIAQAKDGWSGGNGGLSKRPGKARVTLASPNVAANRTGGAGGNDTGGYGRSGASREAPSSMAPWATAKDTPPLSNDGSFGGYMTDHQVVTQSCIAQQAARNAAIQWMKTLLDAGVLPKEVASNVKILDGMLDGYTDKFYCFAIRPIHQHLDQNNRKQLAETLISGASSATKTEFYLNICRDNVSGNDDEFIRRSLEHLSCGVAGDSAADRNEAIEDEDEDSCDLYPL